MTETTVLHYLTASGRCPFQAWIESVKSKTVKAAVAARINRIRSGIGVTMRHERKALPAAVPHEGWLLDQLKDAEFAAEYLNASLAEGDQAAFMLALRDVARARGGMSAVARRTGMNRVALSRALSEKGNPELRSLSKILDASGVRLQFVAQGTRRRAARAARAA